MDKAQESELFPNHVCVLARSDNPDRCASVKESNHERCTVCRKKMQSLMWNALYSGDWSLVSFLLPSRIDKLNAEAVFYDSSKYLPYDPILIVGSTVKLAKGSVDIFIIPRNDGTFEVFNGWTDEDNVAEEPFDNIEDAYEYFCSSYVDRCVEGGGLIETR